MIAPVGAGYVIRQVQRSDLERLVHLDDLCFDPVFRFPPEVMLASISHPDAETWLAVPRIPEKTQCAGFVVVQWKRRCRDPHGYVVTLDVHPECRRRGLAAQLLHIVEENAQRQQLRALTLHVWTENIAALALYRALGFQATRRHLNFYGPGLDAWSYRKDLKLVKNPS